MIVLLIVFFNNFIIFLENKFLEIGYKGIDVENYEQQIANVEQKNGEH